MVADIDGVLLTPPPGLKEGSVAELEGVAVAETDSSGSGVAVGDTVSLGVTVGEQLDEPLRVPPTETALDPLGVTLGTRVPPTTISYIRTAPPPFRGTASTDTLQQNRGAFDAFKGSPVDIIVNTVVSGNDAAR